MRSLRVSLIFGVLTAAPCGAPVFYDVKDYGKVQSAVDAAAQAGGGVVFLPAGKHVSGTIHLRSNISILLAPGAVLVASANEADFDQYEKLDYDSHADRETTFMHYALLAGDGIENVAIVGQGTIDGNRPKRGGPKPIALKHCRRVSIRGVRVVNSPNYAISLLGSDYVDISAVTIENSYADGIDPDSSRFVRISDSYVDSHDDAICLKASLALGAPRSTENVTVTNCTLRTDSNNLKLGTESSGDFKNIAFSNCTMSAREGARRAISGLSVESVDGSHIDGIVASNLTMRDVDAPIFIRLGNRGRGLNPKIPGTLENVSVANVVATGARIACSITGLEGQRVKRISLADIRIAFEGGERREISAEVPEFPEKYPEAKMFGPLPAYGLYARHVEELTLRDVRLRHEQPDVRPSILAGDFVRLDAGQR